jgi:glycosyltransferase involved in cell wall biosynthesis
VVVPHGVEDDFKPLPNRGEGANSTTLQILNSDKHFKFLTIFTALSYPHRKGIDKSIEAFAKEFKKGDNVSYIIKTEDRRYLRELIEKHQPACDIIIIDEKFSLGDLVRTYNIADCYVSAHRGEAWALDVSNSIGCGLPVICTKYGGPLDYAKGYVEWVGIEKKLVPGTCFSNMTGLYAEPKLADLQGAMREATKHHEKKRVSAIKKSSKFHKQWTWDKAGKILMQEIKTMLRSKYGDRMGP